MPLHVLVILVVGGIGGIALVLHLLGLSRGRSLSGKDAKAEWNRHFPDDHVISVEINADASAALVHRDTGYGLLWQFGDDTVARDLVDAVAAGTATGLRLRFADFTAPRVDLRLTSFEQEKWARLIQEQS